MTTLAQRTVAVIPARYGSTRFPGKPLAMIAGKPMIEWVYRQVRQTTADHVLVATDDDRILECVRGFGGIAVMTSPDHPTGTDRIVEAISDLDADLVLNVQGDEPTVPPDVLNRLIERMQAEPRFHLGTAAVPIDPASPDAADPNVVKVVIDRENCALYFSRAPIPYARNERRPGSQLLHHWGIYVYRRDFLDDYVSWPQSDLEMTEGLEQLRALDHGARIFVLVSDEHPVGVDVPEDIARVETMLKGVSR